MLLNANAHHGTFGSTNGLLENSIAKELNRAGNVKIIVNDIAPMKDEAEAVSLRWYSAP